MSRLPASVPGTFQSNTWCGSPFAAATFGGSVLLIQWMRWSCHSYSSFCATSSHCRRRLRIRLLGHLDGAEAVVVQVRRGRAGVAEDAPVAEREVRLALVALDDERLARLGCRRTSRSSLSSTWTLMSAPARGDARDRGAEPERPAAAVSGGGGREGEGGGRDAGRRPRESREALLTVRTARLHELHSRRRVSGSACPCFGICDPADHSSCTPLNRREIQRLARRVRHPEPDVERVVLRSPAGCLRSTSPRERLA